MKNLRGNQNAAALREMKALCNAKGIRLIVFTHPEHQVDMDRFVFEEYAAFLRQIASVTEFWDFSGYTEVSQQNVLYYEPGHYRPPISELIAAQIFGNSVIKEPKSFGVMINATNIDERIAMLAWQFKDRDGWK